MNLTSVTFDLVLNPYFVIWFDSPAAIHPQLLDPQFRKLDEGHYEREKNVEVVNCPGDED